MDLQKKGIPRIGLFACFSGGSNTGSLTGLAALEVVKALGSETVGICSLPAILNSVPRQSALMEHIEKRVIVDGCHQSCAKRLLAEKGIVADVYINLETDLQMTKHGPFTSLEFTQEEVRQVADAIMKAIR